LIEKIIATLFLNSLLLYRFGKVAYRFGKVVYHFGKVVYRFGKVAYRFGKVVYHNAKTLRHSLSPSGKGLGIGVTKSEILNSPIFSSSQAIIWRKPILNYGRISWV
jgi:hypothetical protein